MDYRTDDYAAERARWERGGWLVDVLWAAGCGLLVAMMIAAGWW